MGHYTEIIFAAQIKDDKNVIDAIRYINGDGILPPEITHPFFQCPRRHMLTCGFSYYFPRSTYYSLKYDDISHDWSLSFRSNLKNYDDEIELFLDFIKPYIEQGAGEPEFYAIVTDEQGKPVVYYMEENEENDNDRHS